MQMYIKKQIGKNPYTFVVEGKNLFEMVMESQKLSFPDVEKCGICGSNEIFLHARLAGEKNQFKYTEIRCKKCKAQLQFGQTQEDPNVFYLRKVQQGENKVFEWKEPLSE